MHGAFIDGLAGNAQNSESVRGIVLEDFFVIRWDGLFLHDRCHHFRRALCIHFTSFGGTVLADHTHSLEIRIKLKPSVDDSAVASIAFEAEDDIGIGVRLVKFESSEFECLDFHGITN